MHTLFRVHVPPKDTYPAIFTQRRARQCSINSLLSIHKKFEDNPWCSSSNVTKLPVHKKENCEYKNYKKKTRRTMRFQFLIKKPDLPALRNGDSQKFFQLSVLSIN